MNIFASELITHLKEKDKIPIANHPIASSSTSNQPNTLVIPNPPPPCDQDDFEDVRFWTRAEWNAFTEKQRDVVVSSGQTQIRLDKIRLDSRSCPYVDTHS
jgi:hypothetical protein